MEFYKINEAELLQFALMLVRISSFLIIMPLFSSRIVPGVIKVLTSLLLTMLVFQFTPKNPQLTWDGVALFLGLKEAFIGICLGYLCRSIMFALDLAGQLIGTALGFNAANVVNPTFNENATVAEQFFAMLGFLVLLSINGHHIFLKALQQSFVFIPLVKGQSNPHTAFYIVDMAKMALELGIKLSSPVLVVSIILNLAQGIIGRVVPQINIFVTSFQINVLVGLTILLVSMPLILLVTESGLEELSSKIFLYLKGS